jgi:hypothetical protein
LESVTLNNLIGLLISPSRGLFVYSPILILSIIGYLNISKIPNKKIRLFLYLFGFSILFDILLYSSFGAWWAGWTYGPRYLTGILPVMVIYVGLFLDKDNNFDKFDKKKILSIGLILLLIWSIFVQIVGAFYYPNGDWDGKPNINLHPERVWDWKDTQIMRSFNAGMVGVHNPLKDFYFIWKSRKFKDIISNGTISSGWHVAEEWSEVPTRWMINNGTIKTYYPKEKKAKIDFSVKSFYKPRTLLVYLNDQLVFQTDVSSQNVSSQNIVANLNEGENTMRFYSPDGCQRPTDLPEFNNQDTRCISLAFQNITLS